MHCLTGTLWQILYYLYQTRNTLAHASLPAKERINLRSGVAGIETASKLDRMETILYRLAEKEDTRDEIYLLEKRKIEVEEELRKSKNRNLDLQLQVELDTNLEIHFLTRISSNP